MDFNRIRRAIYLDIETTGQFREYLDLPLDLRQCWAEFHLSRKRLNEFDLEASYRKFSGIYAEFGKVVMVSIGALEWKGKTVKGYKLKSFSGTCESEILKELSAFLKRYGTSRRDDLIIGHNIREFDIPFLIRRLLINKLPIPRIFQIATKKPWELHHFLDTMNLWKFGDYKNYTSLKTLSNLFVISHKQDDIDGSQIHDIYWGEHDISKIQSYCERDVLRTIQLFLNLLPSLGYQAKVECSLSLDDSY